MTEFAKELIPSSCLRFINLFTTSVNHVFSHAIVFYAQTVLYTDEVISTSKFADVVNPSGYVDVSLPSLFSGSAFRARTKRTMRDHPFDKGISYHGIVKSLLRE